MAEDGKIFDSTLFSAKAAEIQYKRLALLGKVVAQIPHNQMVIKFLADGGIRIEGGGRVVVEDGAVLIASAS